MGPPMTLVRLDTGLFPDADTVVEALAHLDTHRPVECIDVGERWRASMTEQDWDHVLAALLRADRVISL